MNSREVFPVSLDSIDDGVLEMDLYHRAGQPDNFVLYRSAGVDFRDEHRRRLTQRGVEHLYVPIGQHQVYRRILNERLDRIFHDEVMSRSERTRMVRASCAKMIEDALLFPGREESVALLADVAALFGTWSSQEHSEFSYLLDLSAHDYYTVTHSVNVGVGCGLLTRALCPHNGDLQSRFIQGGFLHDIGKREIPENVLNKEGRLDEKEWNMIKAHPSAGLRFLDAHPRLPDDVRGMIGMHHERVDGSGYPEGIAGESIGFAARVCAVVDVFDAISSARPYRGATPPLDTLRIMHEDEAGHFDQDVLNTWTHLVTGLLEDDPERSPMSGRWATGVGDAGLGTFLQEAPPEAQAPGDVEEQEILCRGSARPWAEERRRHPRFPCRLGIKVRFLRRGKDYPTDSDGWVEMRLRDISRGGVQLETPWPLTINDLLELRMPAISIARERQTALVVRVKQSEGGVWTAGLRFMKGD